MYKKFDKRYLVIIIIFVMALLLVVLSVSLKKDRNLNPIEKLVKDTGTFTVNILSSPVNFIKSFIREKKEKNEIYEKYRELANEKEQIESIIAKNENLEDEVEKLKKQLDLNTTLSESVYKNATIVNRNLDYWYDTVTIDKGKTDGIEKNMAVVNYDGLVGYIYKTSNHVSTVKLLGSKSAIEKISVKINTSDGYVYGLISKYDSRSNTYTVEGISENKEIKKGSKVVTTGMGQTFPSGLLIGKVTKVTTDNFDLSKVALAKSSVDYNDLDYVSVLKRKDK